MIPVSLDQEMPHVDGGITYIFKPLTDQAELAIKSFSRISKAKIQPFLSAAQKLVEAESPDLEKDAKAKAVHERAFELARRELSTDEADEKELAAINRLIDTICVSWSGKDALPFPANGKPSQCFTPGDKWVMVGVILGLNNLGEKERKN